MPRRRDPDRDFPWWLLILGATGLWAGWQVATSPVQAGVMAALLQGVQITVVVSVVAYLAAAALGLGLAVMSLSRHLLLRQAARLWIEVMRGIPILVLLLYVAFVIVPGAIAGWNALAEAAGLPPLRTRDVPLLWRAVAALTLAYSAFLAEIFRAGLMAVPEGQVEAAESLGLSRGQIFRLIVFPQGFRVILPPLGNDFVAMVKDSSLVSVLGVTDVTQLGKVISAGNFRYFETYNLVALIYLTLTVGLSLILRRIEARLRAQGSPRD
ncbi:amino acid ABC transporter permease [Frigidibacter oleivorans]|uniref:amino acid ABC transporter permease n=1 Tax=Frigidibacter oleivorans TaxID=2487129 RepID=UPI000F8DA8AD|nr:amino acid ABC transporter permease [Frigidibacter oleivorans]